MIKVKGSVLLSRLAMVRENGGPQALEKVMGRLPAEDQTTLRRVLATHWCPFELGQRLDQAIVDVLGGGKLSYFEKLGEASAAKNLSTVHQGFLAQGNPHAFLARAPRIYSFYYDQGRREYAHVGPTEAVLTTYDAETFSTPIAQRWWAGTGMLSRCAASSTRRWSKKNAAPVAARCVATVSAGPDAQSAGEILARCTHDSSACRRGQSAKIW